MFGERAREKSAAAVGVDEKLMAISELLAGELEQRFGDGVVGLLEECVCAFAERVVAFENGFSAESAQRFVDGWCGDSTVFDVEQFVAITSVKSDGILVDMNADAVAKAVFMRRGDDRAHRDMREFSDAAKGLLDLPGFDFKLMRVADVLIAAAAAASKIRAFRRDAMRRGFFDGKKFAVSEGFFLFGNARGDFFAVDGERDEDDFSVVAGDACATEGDVANGEVDGIIVWHGWKRKEALAIS